MMRIFQIKRKLTILCILSIFFIQCVSTPIFDQYSFDQTIDAKVETLGLMENATQEFSAHKSAIKEHLQELQKIYEYDKRRSHNLISAKMWEVMLDENRNSIAGFFNRWKQNDTLNEAFVTEAIIQIEESFDLLLDYESAKDKSKSDDLGTLLLSFISNI